MFLYEKFKEAEQVLLDRITIPDYYYTNVDSTANLKATHVNCPVHDDSTASFRYFEDTDTFSCYGCGKGGNVIVLHRFILKREFGEPDDSGPTTYSRALLDLAKVYKFEIPSFYSKDYSDNSIFDHKFVSNLEVTIGQYPYKSLEVYIDKLLLKLKKSDFDKFLKLASMLDSLEYLSATREEKAIVYQTLLRQFKVIK